LEKEFTKEWKDWINLNITRGCDKDVIFKILVDEGFDPVIIQKQMNYKPSVDISSISNPHKNSENEVDPGLISNIIDWFVIKSRKFLLNNSFNYSNAAQIYIPNAQKLDSKLAEFYFFPDFLNDKECSQLIRIIRSKLRPSAITNEDEPDTKYRTSSTCDLGIMNDKIVADIDQKICDTIGINSSYSEIMQGQYYEIGQEFKAHTDYFQGSVYRKYTKDQGQRTYTFMVYLNDVDIGGETEFRKLQKKIKPQKGMAIIWNNLNKDGSVNSNTIHQAHPVLSNKKVIITKWFRSRGKGPMFTREFDDRKK